VLLFPADKVGIMPDSHYTNISGSFLGISLYEYFHDKMQGRTPIVTAYNFR